MLEPFLVITLVNLAVNLVPLFFAARAWSKHKGRCSDFRSLTYHREDNPEVFHRWTSVLSRHLRGQQHTTVVVDACSGSPRHTLNVGERAEVRHSRDVVYHVHSIGDGVRVDAYKICFTARKAPSVLVYVHENVHKGGTDGRKESSVGASGGV